MSEARSPDGGRDLSSERSESARSRDTRTAPSASVLVFFDYACVFCYTERFRLERAGERFGVELTPIPFELRASMPEEGYSAAEHGLAHGERVDGYLQGKARRDGFPLVVPDHIPNTHRALVLGEVARDAGRATHERVHAAIFDAYFGRGLDIGDRRVLVGIATDCGVDPAEVRRAWDEGTYEARLEEFHELGHRLGVNQTPAALVCDELLVGSQPYRRVAEAVERCLARTGTSG